MDPKCKRTCKRSSLRKAKLKTIPYFFLVVICFSIVSFFVAIPALVENRYSFGIATEKYQHEGVSDISEGGKISHSYSSSSSTRIEDVSESEISEVQEVTVSAPDKSEIESEDDDEGEDGEKPPRTAKLPKKEPYVSSLSLTEEDEGRIDNVDQLPSESLPSLTSITNDNGIVKEERDPVSQQIQAEKEIPESKLQINTSALAKESTQKDEDKISALDQQESLGWTLPRVTAIDLPTPYCCILVKWSNAGHALTENVLDLHRCGPVVSFKQRKEKDTQASHFQFLQIGKMLEKKIVTEQECVDFYRVNPTLHPKGERMAAFSSMSVKINPSRAFNSNKNISWDYDAVEVAKGLRSVQGKVLSLCGMKIPKYRDFDLGNGDGDADSDIVENASNSSSKDDVNPDLYEQLIERSPSKSVIIIKRKDRTILNFREILEMCQGLNLSCRVLDTESFFQQSKTRDICIGLKTFKNSVVIGAQGAEIVYPYYTSGRLLLVTNMSENTDVPTKACRFGNHLEQKEHQITTNLIERLSPGSGLKPYFRDFAAHFGGQQTAITGYIDQVSLEHVKPKLQCKNDPRYCADLTADIGQIKSQLELLMRDGQLLSAINDTNQ